MFTSVLGNRGLIALRQILLVPILIRTWGADLYGQWLVVTAIPTFLAMSNLGLGTSAQIRIAIDTAAGRKQDVSTVMVTAIAMILIIAAIVSFLVLTLIPWLYEADFKKVHITQVHLVLLFLILSLFVRMLAQPMSGLWTGSGMPSTAENATNICSFAELICSFVVPFGGGGPFELALFLLITNIFWLVWFASKSLRLMCEQGISRSMPNWKMGRALTISGIGYQLGSLWQAILFQGSIVLANSILGPVGAATWGSLRVLTRFGNQALELVSQTLGPEFQLAVGNGDLQRQRRLCSLGFVISLVISTLTASCVIIVAPYLFPLWAGGGIKDVSLFVWAALAGALIPFSLWWIAGEYQRSIGQPWLYNIWGVVSSVVAVGVMLILQKYGLLALSLGSFAFDIMMAIFIIPLTLKKLHMGFMDTLRIGIADMSLYIKKFIGHFRKTRN